MPFFQGFGLENGDMPGWERENNHSVKKSVFRPDLNS